MATWKTDEIAVRIRFRGTYDFEGPAGTVFRVPDALYDEIDTDLKPNVPGFVWLTASDTATSMTLAEADGSPSGTATKLILPNGSLSLSGSTATLAITADPDTHGITSTYHTAAGLTTGDVLRATAADGFGFGKIGAAAITQVYSSTISGAIDPSYITQVYQSVISPAISAGISSHDIVGAYHTASGLTAGDVLTALTTSTFGFAAPATAIRVSNSSATASDYVARIKSAADTAYTISIATDSDSVGVVRFGSPSIGAAWDMEANGAGVEIRRADGGNGGSWLTVQAWGTAIGSTAAVQVASDQEAAVVNTSGHSGAFSTFGAYVQGEGSPRIQLGYLLSHETGLEMSGGSSPDFRLVRTGTKAGQIDGGGTSTTATLNVVGTLLVNGNPITASGSSLAIEEADGSPSVATAAKLVFPNGTLSVSGSTATYTAAAASTPVRISLDTASATDYVARVKVSAASYYAAQVGLNSSNQPRILFKDSASAGTEITGAGGYVSVHPEDWADGSARIDVAGGGSAGNGQIVVSSDSAYANVRIQGGDSFPHLAYVAAHVMSDTYTRVEMRAGGADGTGAQIAFGSGTADTKTARIRYEHPSKIVIDGSTATDATATLDVIGTLLVNGSPVTSSGTSLTVGEIDGSPSTTVTKLLFPNSTIAISGATATYTAAAASAVQVSLDTAAASGYVARIKMTGDTAYRAEIGLSSASVGRIAFGSGTAPSDVELRRKQAYSLVLTNDQTGAFSQLEVRAPAGTGDAQLIADANTGGADGSATLQLVGGDTGTASISLGAGTSTTDIRFSRESAAALSIDAGALTASATVNVVGTLQQNGTAVSISGHTHAGGTTLTVAEIDGSPATTIDRLVFPNSTIAISGSTATYTPAAAGAGTITVKEIDGSPSTAADTFVVPNGALSVSGATATAWFAQSKNGGMEVVSTVASAGASQTLNLANGNVFDLTLTSNTCTLTFSGATSGAACGMTIIARQDSTGGRTLAWPGAVSWSEGSAPTQTTTASSVSIYNFLTVDGGTTWYGFASDATGTTLTVAEVDGSPASTVSRVVFPNGSLSISGATATYTPAATGTAVQVSLDTAAASDYVSRIKMTGDTAYRVEIGLNSASTGRIVFGNGTSPSDVEINRYTAGYLQLVPTGGTGSFAVVSAQTSTAVSRIELTGGSVGQSKMVMYHSGEANTRVDVATTTAGGRISFGPGTAAADVYLTRAGAAAAAISSDGATGTATLNVYGTLQQGGLPVLVNTGSFATYIDTSGGTAAPAAPAAGYARIYSKADGRIYSKDSAGVEYGPFDAAGAGGASLYIDQTALHADGDEFDDTALTGWTAVNVTAAAVTTEVYDATCLDLQFPSQGDRIWKAISASDNIEISLTCYGMTNSTPSPPTAASGMIGLFFSDNSGNGTACSLYSNGQDGYLWGLTGNAYAASGNNITPIFTNSGDFNLEASACPFQMKLKKVGSTITASFSRDGLKWGTDTRTDSTTMTRMGIIRAYTGGGTNPKLRVGRFNVVEL